MAEPGPRFPLPGEQDPVAGVEVGGEAGLRLKVGAWLGEWLCRETGATIGQEGEESNFKLVLAEPLTEGGSGHVDKYHAPAPAPLQLCVCRFLAEFPGPGLQHIGLCTDNIQAAVTLLANNGVQFRTPPPAYYSLVSRTVVEV